MKKVLIILVLAIAIPACVFAGNGLIGLPLGATAAYQKAGAVENIADGNFDLKDLSIDDFKFGADVDVRVLFLDVNGKAFLAKNDKSETLVNGIVSANLALDIAIVRLKAGLGYQYTFNTKTSEMIYGSTAGVKDFADFKNANFDIHVGVDVLLGDLTIGAYATLPTEVSVGKGNWGDLFSTVEKNWKAAQIGVGVGFSIV